MKHKSKNRKGSLFWYLLKDKQCRESFIYMILCFIITTIIVYKDEIQFFNAKTTDAKTISVANFSTSTNLELEFYIDGKKYTDSTIMCFALRDFKEGSTVKIEYTFKNKLKIRVKPNGVEKVVIVLNVSSINTIFFVIFFAMTLNGIKQYYNTLPPFYWKSEVK